MQDPTMPQDESSTMDMISQTLHKLADEMMQMESDRMLPEGHPKKSVSLQAEIKPEGSPEEEAMETPDQESSEDSGMLDDMLGKADQADDDGSMPEDHEDDLPPEIMDAVRKKKALQK